MSRPSVQATGAGVVAAIVGFASTFAVILRGLEGVGASHAQAASGLMAVSVAMGLCGMLLSLRRRLPISVAWSTPGAALLATAGVPTGGFAAAVGAFLLTGVLIVASGLFRPLGRWVAAIPAPLANAMLAGVLLPLCLAPVQAVVQAPAIGLAIIAAWAVLGRIRRLFAVPAAVLVAAVFILATAPPIDFSGALWPTPLLVAPIFTAQAAIGIALPLFIVTMASQNIPGIAVLASCGYRPAPGPLFTATGIASLLGAPFGAHAVNLAAITAALCAGPDAHADPARRWWAAFVAGFFYLVFGLFAGAAAAFVAAAPPVLIEAVAGLALLGAFAGSLMAAVNATESREAAVITFVVSASGVAFLGIGGAFWGLLAGGAMLLLNRRKA